MNRHFFNFIAMFNSAAKTRKWTFIAPIRNKFVWVFLNYLVKEKFIDGFSFEKTTSADLLQKKTKSAVLLGKKFSNYYCPVKIFLKHEIIYKIHSMSTPGKKLFMNKKDLALFSKQRVGKLGTVICMSSKLKRLCTSNELIAINEGGLVLCVIKFY